MDIGTYSEIAMTGAMWFVMYIVILALFTMHRHRKLWGAPFLMEVMMGLYAVAILAVAAVASATPIWVAIVIVWMSIPVVAARLTVRLSNVNGEEGRFLVWFRVIMYSLIASSLPHAFRWMSTRESLATSGIVLGIWVIALSSGIAVYPRSIGRMVAGAGFMLYWIGRSSYVSGYVQFFGVCVFGVGLAIDYLHYLGIRGGQQH